MRYSTCSRKQTTSPCRPTAARNSRRQGHVCADATTHTSSPPRQTQTNRATTNLKDHCAVDVDFLDGSHDVHDVDFDEEKRHAANRLVDRRAQLRRFQHMHAKRVNVLHRHVVAKNARNHAIASRIEHKDAAN